MLCRLLRPVLLVALTAVVGIASAGQAMAAGKGTNTAVSCPVAGGARVVLDPGHGGPDSGAVNAAYGLREKDVTLDVAVRAQALLQNAGYTVALTRTTDVGLGNAVRGNIANACGAAVFVEIHLNGSSDASVDYTKTFWGKKGKDLGFSQVMDQAMNGLGIRNAGVGQFANGGLLTATMPSTLVESVFLTNDGEAERLVAGTRQDEIAAAIAAGVEGWVAPS